jgi:glutathione S-transferase
LQYEDGSLLTELPALMTAISQLAPASNLLGGTQTETCRVYEWLNWLSGTVHDAAYGAWLRPARFLDDVGMHDALREKARRNIEGCYAMIEERLGSEGGVWAVREGFTAVDVFLFPIYRWGNWHLGLDMREMYPMFTALMGKVLALEGTRAALRAEGRLSHLVSCGGRP